MGKLETVSRKLEAPLQSASNIFLIVILVLIFSEVVSRYIFGQSRGFMEDFSTWAQVWLVYLMLGVIEKGRGHISLDILPRRLPERYKLALFLVFDIATLSFTIVLGWAGIESILAIKELGLVSQTEIAVPLWIARLCIPLGAMFLAFFSIERLAIDIVSLGKHAGNKE
jgi:TRAP-type C4-dicarboxylate transport system permease small subunit